MFILDDPENGEANQQCESVVNASDGMWNGIIFPCYIIYLLFRIADSSVNFIEIENLMNEKPMSDECI